MQATAKDNAVARASMRLVVFPASERELQVDETVRRQSWFAMVFLVMMFPQRKPPVALSIRADHFVEIAVLRNA
jgi:hypothetical protein